MSSVPQSSESWPRWSPKSILDRVQRLILNRSQVQLHAQAAATESIRRNIQRDDTLAHEWRRHNMRLLYGGGAELPEDDPVGDTYYGDVITQHVPRPGMGTAAKIAAAAIVGLGLPAGALLWRLPEILAALRPTPPPASAPAGPDTTLDVGLRGGEAIP